VNYSGKLLDGTEFDSSYKRGEPAKFQLNHVIPGWSEGVGLMKAGAKYELFVPPSMAYDVRPRHRRYRRAAADLHRGADELQGITGGCPAPCRSSNSNAEKPNQRACDR
jgi:FKBP-type peptidyl-prolyl cis-trans isomerase 2